MNDTAPTVEDTFKQKITDRLREDIGNLMPDEMLQKLVDKATQEMFFTKQITKKDYGREEVQPSWFETKVKALLELSISKIVDKYLEDNASKLTSQISETLTKEAPHIMASMFISVITRKDYELMSTIGNIKNALLKIDPNYRY